jgi:hypothetical protein
LLSNSGWVVYRNEELIAACAPLEDRPVGLDGLHVFHFPTGDMNCDGAVNGFDIDPFVLVVSGDLDTYYDQYPRCDHMLGDCNGDGAVNGFDIDPFVILLGGG